MKKFIYLIIVSLFIFSIVSPSWAIGIGCGEKMQIAQAQESGVAIQEGKAIEVGNKICPVSGEKINEKTKATYEYKGKIYNFCCTACIEEFKKDPEKYIKKIEEEKQKEETKRMPVMEEHQGHHQMQY